MGGGAELSIFIDESGDFGPYGPHSPYYLVALVFHDQSADISNQVSHLKQHVAEAGFEHGHAIHAGPLIRREEDYRHLGLEKRRKLFRRLFDFARICDIRYKTFVFNKREFESRDELVRRISREISLFVRDNLGFFQSFDSVIAYYDNGQKEITAIIKNVFSKLVGAEIRKVKPSDYCLFQAADMFCTLELAMRKLESGRGLSKSEVEFFQGRRALKKRYLTPMRKKRIDSD